MSETAELEPEAQSAYEALIEFLYLAPVGIVKFRPDGTIDMANPTAAQLLIPLAADGDMSDLYRLFATVAPDLRSHVERFQSPAGQIFDQMQLAVPGSRTILMLDINKINDTTLMAVVQNITDLTEARREVVRRTEAQRLLASVFMRLTTPVVINRADGFILLTNMAFQNLIGYDAKSLVGLNIDALLPPDPSGAAEAARMQQALDGKPYEVDIELVAKDGTRLTATMNSALLDESESKHLRVITLAPHPLPRGALEGGVPARTCVQGVSQVRTISLAPISKAIGADWAHISSRAMMLTEAIIKPMLGPSDILKRGKNDCFIVWFAEGEPAQHNLTLARATQAVRTVFMTQFGTRVAERVRAATVG
ncbi:PAS domain S-box protein [Roseomonas nepalensis]|uniref:PAS domain S-box protein n=1 Tax=Muricoccus nepalensis TaxID=1854500 RepID=A0A502FUR8_9PROT|nr:PAS domain S-box protein [Roseomonas nepalensis]TPG53215.1 PAS domain S-box protein [Roseomonas nepalensis]